MQLNRTERQSRIHSFSHHNPVCHLPQPGRWVATITSDAPASVEKRDYSCDRTPNSRSRVLHGYHFTLLPNIHIETFLQRRFTEQLYIIHWQHFFCYLIQIVRDLKFDLFSSDVTKITAVRPIWLLLNPINDDCLKSMSGNWEPSV